MAQGPQATQSTQCTQCGAVLSASTQFCTQCGAPRSRRNTPPRSRVASGTRPARPQQLAVAASVDVIVFAVLVAVIVVLALAVNDVNLWIVCALTLALAVSAHIYVLMKNGQSMGARIAGVRLISSDTGSAPGTNLKLLRVMDVRRGADPVVPQMPPFELALGARTPVGGHAAVAHHKKGWVLVIDEERRVALTGSFVVGRNPAVVPGETALAIPDLGRMLSKGHLRFESDSDGGVFVTDLGSTNGSHIGDEVLPAHQRVPITAEARIHAGDHVFRVENRARTLQGAKR